MRGYLGLGSNVGERLEHLRAARAAIDAEPGIEVVAASSVYETEAQDDAAGQADFLNAALAIETELEPLELLDRCKAIEASLGREAGGPRHAPRTIDVDVLLLGEREHADERLTLPHPAIPERRFVLEPLVELDPRLCLPDGTPSRRAARAACGAARRARRDPVGVRRDNQRMLLAIDAGNTQTHLGLFDGEELVEHWRLATVRTATTDELAVTFSSLLELRGMALGDVDGAIVSSVVPQLTQEYHRLSERQFDGTLVVVSPAVKTGMPIRIRSPHELGTDRLMNAVAAYEQCRRRLHRRRLRHLDQLRRRLGRRGVPRRGDLARRRDLDGRACQPRRALVPGRPRGRPSS